MPQTFYEVLWIFIIYAFIGWCSEVSYAALDRGIFVNRGFLNGPYCPIYGCGVLIVVVLLTPLKKSADTIFRFLPFDISSGIYNRICNGKSIS